MRGPQGDYEAEMRRLVCSSVLVGALVSSAAVVVSPGSASAAADISGTVVDELGAPIENVDIYVCQTVGGCFGAIPTDTNGDFTILSMPDDDYRLRFTPPTDRHVREWWDDQPTEELGVPAPLTATQELRTIRR